MPPTIVPSLPAPGRRLLILRNDTQVPAAPFLTFEGLNASPSSVLASTKRNSLLFSPRMYGPPPAKSEASPPADILSGAKKRWSFFRTVRARGNQDDVAIPLKENEPGRVAALRRMVSKESLKDSAPSVTRSGKSDGHEAPGVAPRRNASTDIRSSFRFSLEWVTKDANMVKGRRLYPPKLPLAAQTFLREEAPESLEASLDELALQEKPGPVIGEKYLGRALSEWGLVVNECQNFFDRRKSEGVSSDALVETPTLGVDWFRKTG